MSLMVDPARMYLRRSTEIYVRALGPDDLWGNYDIAELDAPSLLEWLRSRGGRNEWAENTVLSLLRHDDVTVADLEG